MKEFVLVAVGFAAGLVAMGFYMHFSVKGTLNEIRSYLSKVVAPKG